MSVQIYYKTTIWGLVEFNDTETIVEKIIEHVVNDAKINDLYKDSCLADHIIKDDILNDTEGEILNPEENNGFETIVIIKNNEHYWDNKNGLRK